MTKKEFIIEYALRHGTLPPMDVVGVLLPYFDKSDKEKEEEMKAKVLDSEIIPDELGKSGKKYVSILNRYGIRTVGDLARSNKPYLIKLPGIGKKFLTECDELLESYNLSFGMKD